MPGAHDESIDRKGEFSVRRRRQFTISGFGNNPESRHIGRRSPRAGPSRPGGDVEHHLVFGERRAVNPGCFGQNVERGHEIGIDEKIQRGVAPLQHSTAVEAVIFKRFDEFLVKGQATPRRANVPSACGGLRDPAIWPEFRRGSGGGAASRRIYGRRRRRCARHRGSVPCRWRRSAMM